jgi:hypothetical protein
MAMPPPPARTSLSACRAAAYAEEAIGGGAV